MKRILTLLLVATASAAFPSDAASRTIRNFETVFRTYADPASGHLSNFVDVPLLKLQPTPAQRFASASIDDYKNERRWHVRKLVDGEPTGPEIEIKRIVIFRAAPPSEWSSRVFLYLNEDELSAKDEINVSVDVEMKSGEEGEPNTSVFDQIYDGDPVTNKLKGISCKGIARPQPIDVEPSIKQDQKMLDGSKQSVGELAIKGKYWLVKPPTPIYAVTDSVISSSSDDIAAKFDVRLGTKQYLPKSFTPWFFEVGVVANQRFSNNSLVATIGLDDFILPLGLTYGVGYYGTDEEKDGKPVEKRRISIAPRMRLGVQFAHQFERDERVETVHSQQNTVRLVGSVELVRLFLGRLRKGPNNNISLTANATGWYFPMERATGGFKVRQFEGLLTVGLTFELNQDLAFKLTWTTGSQEANNFARTSTFGFAFVNLK